MNTIDLFCGCGGLSMGFRNAGFTIVAAFDNWQPALTVYRANIHDHPAYHCDLRTMYGSEALFGTCKADVIIGGPPCQDFSSAGKQDESLGRANLTMSFAAIVTSLRPQWFVMENVERARVSRTLASAREMFTRAGYGLSIAVLDASFCGVPQRRKRLFVIGEMGGQDGAVLPFLHQNLSTKPLSVREYCGDSLPIDHYYRHPTNYTRRGVFSIDEPSPTIRGTNRPIPPGYKAHPGDTAPLSPALRPLTTKERSQIQTFPPECVWLGNKTDVEQMIGNAVPVKLAEYVATCLARYIKEADRARPLHTTTQR